MNGTAHAGLAVEALVFVYGVLLVRWAFTGGRQARHRARRRRPVAVEVPACRLVPARQLAACRPDCGTHITTHTTEGDR